MVYALDTNIIIHLLRQAPAVMAHRDATIDKGGTLIIPPYVNFEIQRGFQYVPAPSKEQIYKQLCERCGIGEMNKGAWERAAVLYGDLRKKRLAVGDADLLIAAFCIENDYILVTNNVKHFGLIDGLEIEDWTAE